MSGLAERSLMNMDIAESIPGLVEETVVVIVGDDTFPAAYEYRGEGDDGHRWVGTGTDEYESIPQWEDGSRILAVFFPPPAESRQDWYPVFGRHS